MAGTDFFDEDLTNREATKRTSIDVAPVEVTRELHRPVSDLNLTRLARHREELDHQVAESVQELDRIRTRQDEIERKRRELEEQRTKQDTYENSKRELTDRLGQSLIMMEKEEIKSDRLLEMLRASRTQFKSMQAEIEGLDEENWSDDEVREKLNRALVILDESRIEYNKTIARIETVMSGESDSHQGQQGLLFRDGRSLPREEKTFGRCFLTGLATSLPLMLFSILFAVVFFVLKAKGVLSFE